MLRVCLVAPGELYGGVERQIVDLACSFANHATVRADVVLFHDAALAATLRERGIDPVVLETAGAYDPRAPRRLDAVLKDRGARVVHVHGYRGAVTLALGRVARRLGVVKTEHGLPETHGGPSLSALKLVANARLDDWATRRLRAAVAYVTDDLMGRCRGRHEGLARRVVPNGIPPAERSGAVRPDDLPTSGPVLGIVGRVSEVKGIDVAVRALADPAMPSEAVVVVIGRGPSETALRSLAADLGVSERIRFLGFREGIYDYLAHLDALLMPSRHEGLPYTLLEAMTFGVPVLASEVGGLREVVTHGTTGLLFPPEDPSAVARACRTLLTDDALRRSLGGNAADDQRKRFTLERMVERYVEMYEEAAGERGFNRTGR